MQRPGWYPSRVRLYPSRVCLYLLTSTPPWCPICAQDSQLRTAEAEVTRRDTEASHAVRLAVARAEDAAAARARDDADKTAAAELRAVEAARRADAAARALEESKRDVDRVRQEKEREMAAAVARAKEDGEAAVRIELDRIRYAEEAAKLRAQLAEERANEGAVSDVGACGVGV